MKINELLTHYEISSIKPSQATAIVISPSTDGTMNNIHHDPNEDVTTDTYFRKYENSFKVHSADEDDSCKARLLLQNIAPA
ncbi:unnamed protein product [Trichobilharzia regenti]|nr:unnamed protein product [Trichobilharzia regenti]